MNTSLTPPRARIILTRSALDKSRDYRFDGRGFWPKSIFRSYRFPCSKHQGNFLCNETVKLISLPPCRPARLRNHRISTSHIYFAVPLDLQSIEHLPCRPAIYLAMPLGLQILEHLPRRPARPRDCRISTSRDYLAKLLD